MARYEHLPIYKSALDLTVHFEKLVAGFSRYHKYTLGTELREGSRAVLMQVLRDRIDALLMSVRVAKEVKAFKSFTGYLFVVEQVGSVARQNEGWFKSTQQRPAAPGRPRPGGREGDVAPSMGA